MGNWYFRHDFKAKSDSKVLDLEVEFGEHVGYALWFKLLECMGESGGKLPISKINVYSLALRISKSQLHKFIDYCVEIGLLCLESDCYVNKRFTIECERISQRSESASANAKQRWEGHKSVELMEAKPDRTVKVSA